MNPANLILANEETIAGEVGSLRPIQLCELVQSGEPFEPFAMNTFVRNDNGDQRAWDEAINLASCQLSLHPRWLALVVIIGQLQG